MCWLVENNVGHHAHLTSAFLAPFYSCHSRDAGDALPSSTRAVAAPSAVVRVPSPCMALESLPGYKSFHCIKKNKSLYVHRTSHALYFLESVDI